MQRRQLEEVLSWRLITELWRRFPVGYCLIETHPGGGQYDCLSLIELDGRRTSILDANRAGGSVHVHHGRSPQSWPEWVERMLTDPRRFLDEVTDAMGTETPANLPKSTPATVSFRFISELLTHAVGRLEKWECRNGCCDTSGYEGGKRTEWFTAFPAAHVNRNKKSVALGGLDLACGYWFLLKDAEPMLCLDVDGHLYTRDGRVDDLAATYAKHGRIWPVIAETALEFLP